MKTLPYYWIASTLLLLALTITACKDDEDPPQEVKTTYMLGPISNPAISGKITFTKVNASSTLTVIELVGTQAGDSHPAHIHANSASEGGPIAISFTPVDGSTGRSETTITSLDNGTPITYEELLVFDGYVNVHLSTSAMSTLIAQGDIGSNSPQ
ncbi:MAG TPA: CHRD domain-containing protein [Cyclobacteriaceae bacterium]|nr:CHRD domain-containing protein [Cyclobacteriaceae bacterium]